MTNQERLNFSENSKKAVERELKLLVRLDKQAEIRKYRGLLKWEGNLEQQRLNQ